MQPNKHAPYTEESSAEGWKIKREISLGDMIAFGAAALSVAYAYSTLDKRMALIEATQTNQTAAQAAKDRAQDDEHYRSLARIESGIAEIRAAVQKIVEKR